MTYKDGFVTIARHLAAGRAGFIRTPWGVTGVDDFGDEISCWIPRNRGTNMAIANDKEGLFLSYEEGHVRHRSGKKRPVGENESVADAIAGLLRELDLLVDWNWDDLDSYIGLSADLGPIAIEDVAGIPWYFITRRGVPLWVPWADRKAIDYSETEPIIYRERMTPFAVLHVALTSEQTFYIVEAFGEKQLVDKDQRIGIIAREMLNPYICVDLPRSTIIAFEERFAAS